MKEDGINLSDLLALLITGGARGISGLVEKVNVPQKPTEKAQKLYEKAVKMYVTAGECEEKVSSLERAGLLFRYAADAALMAGTTREAQELYQKAAQMYETAGERAKADNPKGAGLLFGYAADAALIAEMPERARALRTLYLLIHN